MNTLRVMRNKHRAGKRWLLVEGGVSSDRFTGRGPRWVTRVQHSEHDTRGEAEQALRDIEQARANVERAA